MRINEVKSYLVNMIETCKKTGNLQIAPVYITSKPGMGKTQLIHQIANEFECPLYDARLAQFAPEDLRGVPYPNAKEKITEWFTPTFFPRKDELCILFLDELDKAKPAVQNSALQLLNDRKLGEYIVPKMAFIIAAGNTLNDNSFSIPLSSALNNRMLHIELEEDLRDWMKWATADIQIGENKYISRIEEDIVGFIEMKPDLLHSFNDKERAWPSPRSWEFASKLLRDNLKTKDTNVINLVSMAVGIGASREFHGYRKIYKDIDPKSILKGDYPSLENKEASFNYAISTCIGFYVKNNGLKDAKEAKNCLNFVGKFSEEFRIISLRLMLKRNQLNNKINEWCKKEAEEVVSPILNQVFETN